MFTLGQAKYYEDLLDFEEHRRRVAAISFLSNISLDGSDEIKYDCLKGTKVLKEFQERKRERLNFMENHLNFTKEDCENLADELCEPSSKKLSFAQTKSVASGGASLRDDDMIEEYPEPPGLEEAFEYELKKLPMNLLYRESSDGNNPKGLVHSSSIASTADNSKDFSLIEHKAIVHVKRKSAQYNKHESIKSRHNDSVDSLPNTQSNLGMRLRKISGNISEYSSTNSTREIRYISAKDDKNVNDERLVFVSTQHKVPFAVSSVIPFNSSNRKGGHRHERDPSKRLRTNSGNRPMSSINDAYDPSDILNIEKFDDTQEASYGHLLNPAYVDIDNKNSPVLKRVKRTISIDNRSASLQQKQDEYNPDNEYSPHELEGWLIAGRHRTFLPFSSYVTSVIEYVRPSDMKKELNLKFKERFPHLQLTRSKLQSLKREMKRIVIVECNLDMLTVALSYVYFEMLVLKNSISKANRKFCAASCIILAAKLNDVKGNALKNLIEKTENIFRLNRRDLISSEFAVLVALEFSLHVPTWQIFPHYQRLLYAV